MTITMHASYLSSPHTLHMVAHILMIMSSLLLSLCAVHGFAKASYDVFEDTNLDATFFLNVKGETTLVGAVTGEITSQAGGTSRKWFLRDSGILFASCMECFSELEHKH